MAASDVSLPQDGGAANVKLHPYLITLVRWCMSCVWSAATLLLHRLVTAPRLPVTAGSKPSGPSLPRRAGTEHLHPEARVACVVLHAPAAPSIDVVFVHGLYGSLGNTWRQGEWKTKYKFDPIIVPLRNHLTDACHCCQDKPEPAYSNTQETNAYETNLNENTFNQISGCFKKILPNENSLITENFYNNALMDVNVENYGTQAQFVSELFKNHCDKHCDLNNTFKCNCDERSGVKCNAEKCKLYEKYKLNECKCKLNGRECEAGCGCVCDACYSSCWPRDWIKEDFPGARVISVNYTSDPYLWRPLWVKGNKRLRLHERAAQMSQQLVRLGVGSRPLVWVGHSKGGLFIKQIYCDAYEAHLKLENKLSRPLSIENNNNKDQSHRQNTKDTVIDNIDNKFNSFNDTEVHNSNRGRDDNNRNNLLNNFINERSQRVNSIENGETLRSIDAMNEIRNNNNSGHIHLNSDENQQDSDKNLHITDNSNDGVTEIDENGDLYSKPAKSDKDTDFIDISVRKEERKRSLDDATDDGEAQPAEVLSSNDEEDSGDVSGRARLWAASRGFMFYSVPHRGSPLAHIKTPITSRSVELLEIAKDCPLVLELHDRWLGAVEGRRGRGRGAAPRVRSLVETGRTLMSVLWLRIVSEDSADAGVGSLRGVSVDHREICKPAGRRCPLYTELADLLRHASADATAVPL